MNKVKLTLTAMIVLFSINICNAQSKTNTLVKDLEQLVGSWQGSLTYLDYKSGKPYTMSANIDIKRVGKTNSFIFSNSYPKEPNANSIDTVMLLKKGSYINNEMVKSRKILANGNSEIITEVSGKDGNDNKPATIRHIYTMGKNSFNKEKDVQFIGTTEWIKRNEYAYARDKQNRR